MKLQHVNSMVTFEFIEEYKPQFTNIIYVRLLNLKTNKEESFMKSTYMNHFKEV